jgi:hypothetical protein
MGSAGTACERMKLIKVIPTSIGPSRRSRRMT